MSSALILQSGERSREVSYPKNNMRKLEYSGEICLTDKLSYDIMFQNRNIPLSCELFCLIMWMGQRLARGTKIRE